MVEQNEKPIVVITGVSGYIGSQVCNYFLKDGGFRVRGTVRDKDNQERLSPLKTAFGENWDKLELRNAELLDEASLDAAIEGATYVVHTACPFMKKADKIEEMVDPAVQGVMGALKAAHKHKVKRVVITSSFAAVAVGNNPAPEVYDESCWSNVEMLTAAGINAWGGYLLAKTLAEKAAWDYHKSLDENDRFELVTLCPPFVYGEAFVTTNFESGQDCIEMMHGKKAVAKGKTPNVDVHSVAQAHLNAIKIPEAADQRFLILNGVYSVKEIAESLSTEFSSQGWTIKTEEEGDDVPTKNISNKKSIDILKVDYEKDMGKVMVSMAHSMISTGALKKPE